MVPGRLAGNIAIIGALANRDHTAPGRQRRCAVHDNVSLCADLAATVRSQEGTNMDNPSLRAPCALRHHG
jgi:hypothetical protein